MLFRNYRFVRQTPVRYVIRIYTHARTIFPLDCVPLCQQCRMILISTLKLCYVEYIVFRSVRSDEVNVTTSRRESPISRFTMNCFTA